MWLNEEARVVQVVCAKNRYIYIIIIYIYIYIFVQVLDQMWLNEEARIAQVANINQFPRNDSFTSPPKDAMINTSSFLRVA